MPCWLLKEEPYNYSYEDLAKDGETSWDGVRNNLAQKHLRRVKKGDAAIFYHTGKEKAAVGIVRVTSDPYPDTSDETGKRVAIDVKPVRKLAKPVTLAEIKVSKIFNDFSLVRISRLSVMPVPQDLWDEILKMSKS